MYYYVPFSGGSDCENGIPAGGKSLYLPTEFSGMCVRQGEQGDSDHREADFTQ